MEPNAKPEPAESARAPRADRITVEVFQQDWMPGFAAYHSDGLINETAKAHISLNVGSFMAAIKEGVLNPAELPYFVAESLMHEVVHVLEAWAGVEFSEDRVEALLTKYREKYERATVWEYTGAEPASASLSSLHDNWCDYPKCLGPCNCHLAASQPTQPEPPSELTITIARELYDRFVMGGWGPADAYRQIDAWLAALRGEIAALTADKQKMQKTIDLLDDELGRSVRETQTAELELARLTNEQNSNQEGRRE